MNLMKTLYKVLVLGIMLTAFGAFSVFAQDTTQSGPDLATLFEKFKKERREACGKRDAALATGREIIEKFGNDELNKAVIDYVKKQMPIIEQEDKKCKLYERYNSTYKAKQWDQFFSASKEVMALEGDTPVALDVLLTHVSTGYDLAVAKNNTYNAETVNFAKQAIQKIESGKASPKNWGTYNGFGSKDNSLAWMNYIVGYVTWFNQNQQTKDAIAAFYKSTLYSGDPKNNPLIYQAIGTFYFTEASNLYKQFTEIREANNKTDNDESKAKLALARGYADRAIDAYGRALKIASADSKTTPEYKKILTDTLTDLYKFRFDGKEQGQTEYVSALISKPMPDPSTAVTPVVEEVKPTTTTSTTTSTTTTAPTTSTTNNTKPTVSSKPTTPTTTATTNTKTTTPAKKPVAKKKGTR